MQPLKIFKLCAYMCGGSVAPECSSLGDQRRHQSHGTLELHAVVRSLTWVLGKELRSSKNDVLRHRAISATPTPTPSPLLMLVFFK